MPAEAVRTLTPVGFWATGKPGLPYVGPGGNVEGIAEVSGKVDKGARRFRVEDELAVDVKSGTEGSQRQP